MTKKISIKQFSPELQRAINKEVSSLKISKRVLSKTELSEAAKVFLDKVIEGTWTQRADGKIDVKGNVEASRNPTLVFFMGKEIFFGKVTGDFNCGYIIKIATSLVGSPEEVGGDFDCSWTDITSLQGAPEKVGGDFRCSRTDITSLKGSPRVVGGSFYCGYDTKITSLIGAPEKVGGNFVCGYTKITSLEGAPKVVHAGFYCNNTKITSLEGAPEKVDGDFDCSWTDITSLQGSTKEVGGDFNCKGTKITSLDGIGEVKGRIIADIKVKAPVMKSLTMFTTDLPKFILQKATALQKINNKEALPDTELEIKGTRDDIKVTLSKNNKARQIEHLQALKNQAAKLVALLKKEGIQDVSLEHVETLDMFRELEGSREEDDIIEQFAHVATEVYAIVNLPVNIATGINKKLLGLMQGREVDSFSDDTEYAFGDLDERAQEGRALLQISAYKAEFLVEEVEEDEEDED